MHLLVRPVRHQLAGEREGWKVAGMLIPVGYTLWSVWLLVSGVVLLVTGVR